MSFAAEARGANTSPPSVSRARVPPPPPHRSDNPDPPPLPLQVRITCWTSTPAALSARPVPPLFSHSRAFATPTTWSRRAFPLVSYQPRKHGRARRTLESRLAWPRRPSRCNPPAQPRFVLLVFSAFRFLDSCWGRINSQNLLSAQTRAQKTPGFLLARGILGFT